MPRHARTRLSTILILITFLSALSATALAQQLTITPSTTLAQETANNTSASASFAKLTNDDAAPGNVSKSKTSSLLYSGNTTKIYAHFMGWFGPSSHMSVGYSSATQTQVHKQVADMKSRGVAGAIIDWYGPGSNTTEQTTQLLKAESEAQGFQFAIMEDVGAVGGAAKTNNCDVTQKLIDDLNYAYTTYELSPAYIKWNGRPLVFFFGVEAYYIDWARVRQQVSGTPLFIFRNAGAFTNANSDGGFSWIEINAKDPYNINTAYLDNFYASAVAHPSKVPLGVGYPGFNDTVAGWSGNRVMNQQCAKTWTATFSEIAKYYSTSRQLPLMQLATWNDYEEGSEFETGLDNCMKVFAWMSGSTLNWKAEGTGSESTISYYRVFISTDGQNLMRLKDVSVSTHTLSLSGYGLTARNYTLYVKAVGKPSILNRMSPAVMYRPGDQLPLVKLSVTPTSGIAPLTVTASVSGSTDADGRVVSSKIDFGDGTVVSGPTASHTYNNFNPYTITGYAYDDKGVFNTARVKVTAKQPRAGVMIWSPAASSKTDSFVRVVASALGATNPITSMKVYVDGVGVYLVRKDRLDTFLRLLDGPHSIAINAWDSTGAVFQSKISITTGLTVNQLPIPNVTLSTFTPAIGTPVRACTANSSDPDGGISGTLVNFGDGTAAVRGPTAYHTYSSAGTFTISVTATDNRGASSTTTTTVAVH